MVNSKEILLNDPEKLTLKGVNQFMSLINMKDVLSYLSLLYKTAS
tara:strand:- start:435 stop:569 length:135 start_codon:yes stop_codon:yes gene_type:complete